MSSFFSSLFASSSSRSGETKNTSTTNANVLGNDDHHSTPTLRQISLPQEWQNDNTSDIIESGKFSYGFESLQSSMEIAQELDKIANSPVGTFEKFNIAVDLSRDENPSIWNVPLVHEALSRALTSFIVQTQTDARQLIRIKIPGQHIYGTTLFASTAPECQGKIHNISFPQGCFLRLENGINNDTWAVQKMPQDGSYSIQYTKDETQERTKMFIDKSLVQVSCTMYRLDKDDSEEYQKVMAMFGTQGSLEIISIDRIQNTALYEDFYLRRERMFRRLGAEGLNEKLLWHGCSGNVVLPIASTGFDWRLCGLHGTAYGRGAYFAKNSSYSQNDAYSKPDVGTGYKHIFLTRVLVGRVCQGKSTLQRPPPGVHSAVNASTANASSVFVTFDQAQNYPLYSITFKK